MYANAGMSRFLRVAGWCGIATPIAAMLALALAIGSASWFSWSGSALSDLGVEYPSAYFFNSILILGGAMMMIFSRGLHHFLSGKGVPGIGASMFTGGAFALIFVGIFTADTGIYHSVFSVLFFVLAMSSIILTGLGEMRQSRRSGAVSVVLGLSAAIAFLLPWPGEGIALPEMASIIFFMMFSFFYGMRFLDIRR
jgi:hypothetical membrane protein